MTRTSARRVSLLLLAVLVPVPMVPVAHADGAPLDWWGPRGLDEGFHLRVPVTVTNAHDFVLQNAAVATELDLGAKLLEAGWTSAAGGDRDVLTGFHLDAASIRVVAMTNLLPADNVNGRLKVADATFLPGDDRRYEVPSLHVEGSLERPAQFDASTNPIITVLWRVPGPLAPGESRSFVVYFDSDRTAEAKAGRQDDLTLADGDVRSLFGPGPVLTAFGYVAPRQGAAGRIQVSSLHADTDFEVFVTPVGGPGSSASPLQRLPGGSTFHLEDALDTEQVPVSSAGPVAVKVVSDKPVIVQGASEGFVPAIDGGFTGRDFLFYTLDAVPEQDTLYVKALDPRDDDGIPEPTRVEVTAVANGRVLVYETGSEDNALDYTVGPRSVMEPTAGGCRVAGPSPYLSPGGSDAPFVPTLYRARVVEGERVTLQLLTNGGLTQVPSDIGSPAGQRFWAAGGWTDDQPGRFGACDTLATRNALWQASSMEGPATGNATSPELSYQVSPPGQPSPPGPVSGRYPPPLAIPASPGATQQAALTGRPAADRPLRFATSADAMTFVGANPQVAGAAPVHGPFFGDDGGRVFTGLGRSLVFAPYTSTAAGVQTADTQGTRNISLTISADAFAIVDDVAPSNVVRSYRLEANRPVIVVPTSVSTTFFAGVPAMLTATAGRAEYRGYLIDLASESGLDPLTGSTPPGVPLQHTLRLSNRGRDIDGAGLPDLVRITAQVPAGWTATLDGAALSPTEGPTVSLGGGHSRLMRLVISPPASLPSGQSGTVSLRAESQNNGAVQDRLDAVTFVKTVFDAGLWFDAIDGAKEQENRTMSQAGLANFTLAVQNQGSKPETLRLTTRFVGETTWLSRLGGPDGNDVLDLPLAARESRLVRLTLQAPPGLVDGEATVVVTAEIVGVSGGGDAVQATGARRAPADLTLATESLTDLALPGQDAVFNLTLSNRGAGAANVLLSNRTTASPVWGSPRIVVEGRPVASIVVEPGHLVRLQVRTTAAADATAGAPSTIRFGARPEGSSAGGLEAVLTAIVQAVHLLEVPPQDVPLALAPGTNRSMELRVTNRGNLDEDLLVRVADVPAGWRLDLPTDLLVPRGATVALKIGVTVPPGALPKAGNVSVDLVARDGNVTRLTTAVEVALGTAASTGNVTGSAVQPGQPARLEVPLRNDGNTPMAATARPAPGEAWTLLPTPAIRLLPGESTRLTLAWAVPVAAVDGPTVHRALLDLVPEGLDPSTRAVETTFDVGRPDVTLGSVFATDGPAGRIVHADVTNRGNRPARDFTVALLVDGQPLDTTPVGELRPGASVQVVLLQARPGAAQLAVDWNQTLVEANEDDNQAAVPDGAGRDAPALPLGLGLAALALALRRRRRA